MKEPWTRFLDLFRRDSLDAELQDELSFHQQMLARDARAAGASAEEADAVARRHLGNITGIRERSRDAWSFRWIETLQQDLRYAFRGLRRSPGFTAAVVVTLGLGIGANAAMFGVIDRLMFRPLDYMRDPASVRRVYLQTSYPRHFTNTVFPYTRYLDFQKMTNSFSGFAAFTQNIAVVGVGDEAREEPVLGVSASFFDFFDAQPVAGRFLSAAEDSNAQRRERRGVELWLLAVAIRWTRRARADREDPRLRVHDHRRRAAEGFTGIADGPVPSIYIPITAMGRRQLGRAHVLYGLQLGLDADHGPRQARRERGNGECRLEQRVHAQQACSRASVHPNFMQVESGRPARHRGAAQGAGGPDAGLEAHTLLWVTGVASSSCLSRAQTWRICSWHARFGAGARWRSGSRSAYPGAA